MNLNNLFSRLKGGPGSGNFGHSGRPGKIGGSSGGGGDNFYIRVSNFKDKTMVRETMIKAGWKIDESKSNDIRITSKWAKVGDGRVTKVSFSDMGFLTQQVGNLEGSNINNIKEFVDFEATGIPPKKSAIEWVQNDVWNKK